MLEKLPLETQYKKIEETDTVILKINVYTIKLMSHKFTLKHSKITLRTEGD